MAILVALLSNYTHNIVYLLFTKVFNNSFYFFYFFYIFILYFICMLWANEWTNERTPFLNMIYYYL